MRLVVARAAQPGQVGIFITAQLAPKFSVVNVNPGTELAHVTRLPEVVQSEST